MSRSPRSRFAPAVYWPTRDGRWIRTVDGQVEPIALKCDYAELERATLALLLKIEGN